MLDVHTHIGDWNNEIYRDLHGTLEDYIRQAVSSGIQAAVLMPSDQKRNQDLLPQRGGAKGLVTYFFPWIDPSDPAIMDFLRRHQGQISGLKFSSSYDRIRGVTDPAYAPFVRYALEQDIPVLVHCGRWLEMAGFTYALDLAARYPLLRVLCAHMGGIEPELQAKAQDRVKADGLENVWFDTSAVSCGEGLLRGIDLLGPDRFCFGTDYPIYPLGDMLTLIMALDLPVAIRDKIFYHNAVSFIKG